jgi:autotransporter translocation and assembly factor TamB
MINVRLAAVLFAAAIFVATAAVAQEGRARIDITVERADLSWPELQRLVPALDRVRLPAGFRVEQIEARGPLTALTIEFLARSADSRLSATVTGNLRGPTRTVKGQARFVAIDLARLFDRSALPSHLTAAATFDLTIDTAGRVPSIDGTFAVENASVTMAQVRAAQLEMRGRVSGQTVVLEHANARAYGAAVTAEGRVGLPLGGRPLTYTLQGRAANLDLQRLPEPLPLPAIESDLQLQYEIRTRGDGVTGRARFAESTLAGGVVSAGTVATFDTAGTGLAYTAKGSVRGLDPQRLGRALDVEVLSQDRFAGAISGTFSVEGVGGNVRPLTVALKDSRLFGGAIPSLDATVRRVDGGWQVAADGRFAGVEPGLILRNGDVEGSLTGTLDVTAELPVAASGVRWREMSLRGRVRVTDGSVEGVAIDTLVVDGRYTDQVLRLARLDLEGAGLAASAEGTLALDGSVPSSFTYFVDTPQIAAFRDLIGRPVAGQVRAEGRVTGRRVLRIAGTLAGADVGYDDIEATTINARYDVAVSPQDWTAAMATATAEAAFVRVAGRTLTEATATADYANRVMQFNARVQEGMRTVSSTGRFVLQPRQVSLTSLRFEAPGAVWQMPAGAEARIDLPGSRVRVEDFRLAAPSGGFLAVEGTVSGPPVASPLEIRIDGVSLADVGVLLPGEEGLAGRVDGYAAIRAPLSDPRVDEARLTISGGAVRGFKYETLTVRLHALAGAYQFSGRLVQDAVSWMTAEGSLPLTFFGGTSVSGERGMDVAIRSSPIGLGFVDALTERVRNVQGTIEADVRITGTVADPQFAGHAAIRNGSFLVPVFGATFHGMQATIRFEPDVMVIPDFRLLDENGELLRAEGRLPYSGGQLGAVTVGVTSANFEIVDNEIADIQVSADLTVTGTVLAPRLEGTLRIPVGTIRVDEVLDLQRAGLYRAAPLADGAEAASAVDEEDGILRDLPVALDLTLEAPALTLTGRDLRGPSSLPVGLGNVDITVEGDLRLEKAREAPLRITGDITTVRGTYDFHRRRFEIARGGRIRFPGLTAVNPLLDITASRVISGVETEVRIDGTLRRPELMLDSRPPLDEADILSLIVFNQPANQLGAVQQISLGRRAAALATGFFAGQITESIGGALDLDTLEFETGEGVNGLTPALTLGERFGQRLYLRVRQGFGNLGSTQVALEYEVTDWLRLQSRVSDERPEAQSLFRRSERSALRGIVEFSY